MAENALMGKMGGAGIGSFDGSSFNRSEGPGMMGVANQAIGLARQSTGYEHEQLNLHTQRLGILNSHLASLANDPIVQAGGPDAMKKITEAGGRLVAMGIVPAKQLTIAIGGIDPANPMPALRQAQLNTLEAGQRIQTMYGAPQNIDSGSGIQTQFVSPFNNRVTTPQGGYVQRQLTPGERIAPVAAPPGPNGEQRMQPAVGFGVSTGVVGPDGNLPPQMPPQRPANPLPMQQPQRQPVPVAAPQAGFQPSAVPMPTQPARGVQQPARVAQNPYGAVTTGLPPGQGEAQTIEGGEAGKALASDTAHAANITQKTFPLLQAIPALERLGKTGTGPGTEQFNQVKSFVQSLGLPGVDANKIKDFDDAKKYLTDYVNRQSAGGSVTNDKLAAAFSGNASTGISNAAAQDVAKSAVALERMRAAQAREFQKTGLPASQYQRWATQWNTTQDPRGYGVDLMGPEKFAKLREQLKKSSTAEYERFAKSVAAAHGNELLQPGLMNGR